MLNFLLDIVQGVIMWAALIVLALVLVAAGFFLDALLNGEIL